MRRIIPMGLLAVTALFAAAVPVSDEKEKPIETFTCFAANMQRGNAGVIDINSTGGVEWTRTRTRCS